MPTELTPNQRRQQLEYANKVADLASQAPDDETKQIVYNAVKTIRKKAGWSIDEKRDEILRLVHVGASTVADLIRETNFHKDEVFFITEKLEKEGKIVFKRMSLTGGAGRPAVCIFPK
jgi:hypothetical protein